jgi:hypothetical protein
VKPPRKKRKSAIAVPPPGKVIVQWGDGPRLELERRRHAPLTDEEFWEACKTYFPDELQPLAAAWLLKLSEKARRADAEKGEGKVGRPPGIGSHVEELRTGPFRWDQRTARQLVARRLCDCRDKNGFPAERCTCRAYERVKALHNQWRRDQRKSKSQGQ